MTPTDDELKRQVLALEARAPAGRIHLSRPGDTGSPAAGSGSGSGSAAASPPPPGATLHHAAAQLSSPHKESVCSSD